MPTAKKNDQADLFAAFGEALILLDESRHVSSASMNAEALLGVEPGTLKNTLWRDLVEGCALPDAREGLYWAAEALFEQYLPREFIPSKFPFTPNLSINFSMLDGQRLAVRFQTSRALAQDGFFDGDLRPALTSSMGFTDVILKGIDGPMTDLQLEDLKVIYRDARFALELVQDYHARWIRPALYPPVPLMLKTLLTLGDHDLPLRRIASRQVSIAVEPPGKVKVYSNGALRLALIELLRLLADNVVTQSQITISTESDESLVRVCLSYQPAEASVQALTRIDPLDLFRRREAKGTHRLLAVVSSLHAQLSAFGCTAWAEPDLSGEFTVITMTVPRWSGPLKRS